MLDSVFLKNRLPELVDLEKFLQNDCVGEIKTLARIKLPHKSSLKKFPQLELPLYGITYGSSDERTPILILTGGVHGLERIGTQVVKALLSTFNELVKWDQQLQSTLKQIRIQFIPLVNPWGMALGLRSNPNGIDLMRNAPVEAQGETVPLLSGHRLGSKLPWYRGPHNGPMELESQAIIDHIQAATKRSKAAISLDVHSGFGFRDQLWFPYAGSLKPFDHLPEMMNLKEKLDQCYPYHVYKIEPQAINYVTHGDLWDYLYDEHRKQNKAPYLPLCLELGSWNWVRKNPRQLLKPTGIFDPVLPHRRHRTYRRQYILFDFLIRMMVNADEWTQLSPQHRTHLNEEALRKWYQPHHRKAA